MTLAKTASDGSKSGSDGCFYRFSDCRRACFSLSMQSNDPTKLRIFFGISSLPPCFLRWRRVSEEISCLVVESGKCYQRVGGESFLCCCICRKSHIHRELHGAIKENS